MNTHQLLKQSAQLSVSCLSRPCVEEDSVSLIISIKEPKDYLMKGLHPFNPLRQSHSHWDARRPASLTRQADSHQTRVNEGQAAGIPAGAPLSTRTVTPTPSRCFPHPRCTAERT